MVLTGAPTSHKRHLLVRFGVRHSDLDVLEGAAGWLQANKFENFGEILQKLDELNFLQQGLGVLLPLLVPLP